jgi:hypothetical protein
MALENLTFHVIVDHSERTFWMNGPGGPNGILLHFEMAQIARKQGKTLRGFDLRTPSQETALTELQSSLSGYSFLGPWPTNPKLMTPERLTSGLSA